MIWICLLAAHLCGLSSFTLLLRTSTLGQLDKLLLTALMQTGLFLPAIFFLINGQVSFLQTPMHWFLIILGTVTGTGVMATQVWALSRLDTSVFTIIYNLRLLGTTILGFLILGEIPKPLQIVGGVIILASIFMLNLHKNKQWKSPAILVGIFTMMWFSFHAVLEKYNVTHLDFESYLFISMLGGTALVWIVVFAKKVPIKDNLVHIADKKIYALIATRALSAYAYIYALRYGSLAVTNYVSGMGVVLIVIFGIYVLGEKNHIRQKFTAAGVAGIGLTLILVSKIAD